MPQSFLLCKSSTAALFTLVALAGCADRDGIIRATVDEGEWLPGGETTNTERLGANAFTVPADNLDGSQRSEFDTGEAVFNENWVAAPAAATARDGLGPTFNARSCAGCHFKGGRGGPPEGVDDDASGLVVRISVPGEGAHGVPLTEPSYGDQLQSFGVMGVPAEARVVVTWAEQEHQYGDGERYSLREPGYEVVELAFGPLADEVTTSARVARQVIGMGLLEAIDADDLLAREDPEDEDGDGISGRANRVWDLSAQRRVLGRFGWKAGQPSVLQQTATSLLEHSGITSRLYGDENCPSPQLECQAAESGGTPEISDELLDASTFYAQALAPPAREGWDDPEVLQGKWLFTDIGCAGCHTPLYVTGDHEVEAFRGQTIWPYTDLLLHDMGDALADGRPVFEADGREWRTPPLWGIGRLEEVDGRQRLLHDGRARSVEEAILWHGGEGEDARDAFTELSAEDRAVLMRFVDSL